MKCDNDYCELKSKAEIEAEQKMERWLRHISSEEGKDENKQHTVQRGTK